jgi:hypothetical protein
MKRNTAPAPSRFCNTNPDLPLIQSRNPENSVDFTGHGICSIIDQRPLPPGEKS